MMRAFSPWVRRLGALAGVAGSAVAGENGGLTGVVQGEAALHAWEGAPALTWRLELARGGAMELVVTGGQSETRARLTTGDDGEVAWEITRGRVALAEWTRGVLSRGEGELSGSGTQRHGHFVGTLSLVVRGVDLAELVRFADPKEERVRAAEGRVEGVVGLRFNDDGTVGLGDSELHLAPGTVATVWFQAAPGWLTSYVPEKVRDAYPGLAAIERGQTPLEAKVLRLIFFARGDAEGRTARMRVEGRSKDPQLVAPLELDINVSGPVESLVRQMSEARLHVGAVR